MPLRALRVSSGAAVKSSLSKSAPGGCPPGEVCRMADLTDLYTAPTSHEAGLDSEKMLLFSLQVTVEVGQITILHSSILEEMFKL